MKNVFSLAVILVAIIVSSCADQSAKTKSETSDKKSNTTNSAEYKKAADEAVYFLHYDGRKIFKACGHDKTNYFGKNYSGLNDVIDFSFDSCRMDIYGFNEAVHTKVGIRGIIDSTFSAAQKYGTFCGRVETTDTITGSAVIKEIYKIKEEESSFYDSVWVLKGQFIEEGKEPTDFVVKGGDFH